MIRTLTIEDQRFRIAGEGFAIARGRRTHAHVVTVTLEQSGARGRGECVPYARYGESIESVVAAIETLRGALEDGMDRRALQQALPAGAARNAVDCALWDLEAKVGGTSAHELAKLAEPKPLVTAYTISVDTPDKMAAQTAQNADRPLLKVKLGGAGDKARMEAVRNAAPNSRIMLDANEAWSPDDLWSLMALAADLGVELIEQPLPASADSALSERRRPVPVCADESVHDRSGLAALKDRYDAINIKLDKTGGLTEALALANEAKDLGFDLFAGCMLGTSLAMAPALLIGQSARWVDLDGPLLLAEDRAPALAFDGSLIQPASPALWG